MPPLVVTLALGAAALIALPFVAGALLPATRSASAEALLDAPPERVRALILDIERQPAWRTGIARVERRAEGWTETTARGETIRFAPEPAAEGEIRLRFASDRGYSGRWTGQLAPAPGGRTRLSVTEEATVPAPLTRLLARLFFDPEAYARQYLAELAAALEEG
jgi:hypothetical protein